MGINTAQKFGKVELLLKGNPKIENGTAIQSINKVEFNNAALIITGDHIIVVIDEKDEFKETLTSTGKIFHLNEVSSYRTHAS